MDVPYKDVAQLVKECGDSAINAARHAFWAGFFTGIFCTSAGYALFLILGG